MAQLLAAPQDLPVWLRGLADRVPELSLELRNRRLADQLKKLRPVRQAAVLVLFAGSADASPSEPPGAQTDEMPGVPRRRVLGREVRTRGEEQRRRSPSEPPGDATVLLTRRAASMRAHAGQVAFPGGAVDLSDEGPVAAALREAWEETGVDLGGVLPFAVLDPLFVPPSGFDVTPVLAFWERPSPVGPVNSGETDLVRAVGLDELRDPANRVMGRRGPIFKGPAFALEDMFVWGFTGGLLSSVMASAGWELPWDRRKVVDVAAIARQGNGEPGTPEAVR